MDIAFTFIAIPSLEKQTFIATNKIC